MISITSVPICRITRGGSGCHTRSVITVKPDSAGIETAARALRAGDLVVMPTETVYGLACDALNRAAVEAVFTAKGRPSDNPLIVHGASWSDLRSVVGPLDALLEAKAQAIADRFWPGPLTLVLPKAEGVPPIVTAGRSTIAVRIPGHAVARRLIESAGVLVAAPSANRFMGLSPTRVEDLDPRIAEAAAVVIDAGPCPVGIESTVLDLTVNPPQLLRPGMIGVKALGEALGGGIEVPDAVATGPKAAPGQYHRHYAPNTPVMLVDMLGSRPGLTFGSAGAGQLHMPSDPAEYAAKLYASLAELDRAEHPAIFIERPPDGDAWRAVWDRLRKASSDAGRISP